ncbi:MAG: hypothetical protein DMD76_00055 [Candidatus Rokuibacteriota bacterium]|nr:MAG: hypothetical protein DMD76_00055 [Candidatus Rokubacteria bacterium]
MAAVIEERPRGEVGARSPVIEERHGSPGALRALGGVGGHFGARSRVIEERHGFPGALRALGGVGGHVGAPHDD